MYQHQSNKATQSRHIKFLKVVPNRRILGNSCRLKFHILYAFGFRVLRLARKMTRVTFGEVSFPAASTNLSIYILIKVYDVCGKP